MAVGNATVIIGPCIFRVQLDGFVVILDCLSVVPKMAVGKATVRIGPCIF